MMQFRIANDYAEVSCYFERKFNYPVFSEKFTREDFAAEYDAAFNLIAEELSVAAEVNTIGLGEGDLSMSRYVSLNRAITVVADRPEVLSPAVFEAAHAALQRLPEEYAISFDCHPAYVSVRRSGEVIGFVEGGDVLKLFSFGFPRE